jgi:hypothetical protein
MGCSLWGVKLPQLTMFACKRLEEARHHCCNVRREGMLRWVLDEHWESPTTFM